MRVWEFDESIRSFKCNYTMASPIGPINCLRTIGKDTASSKIWLGGENGVGVVDMNSLAVQGSLSYGAPVVGPFFIFADEYVIFVLKNGGIKCVSATDGNLAHERGSTANSKNAYCSEMMMGPNDTCVLMVGSE